MEMIQNLWTPEEQRLMVRLKEDMVAGSTLEIPDLSWRFYIQMD